MVSPDKYIAGRSAADWIAAYPVVSDLCALKETAWVNPDKLPFAQAAAACPLTLSDIEDAAARLERFAPYLAAVFPETAATGGIIESPVQPIPRMQKVLEERSGTRIAGQVWVKLDSHLPISGSIKARGGIYEEAVPDVLDIVVVLQGIQQLAHCLELIGVGQAGGGHGDHGQIIAQDLVALLFHGLDHSRVVLGIGGDLSSLFACIKVLGTGIQSIHHGLIDPPERCQ